MDMFMFMRDSWEKCRGGGKYPAQPETEIEHGINCSKYMIHGGIFKNNEDVSVYGEATEKVCFHFIISNP